MQGSHNFGGVLAAAGLLLHLFCSTSGAASPARMKIAENGRAQVQIVAGDDPIPAEVTAARELAEYLGKVTGAAFEIRGERELTGDAPAIYVGRTAFARKAGVDLDALGGEEWRIRTVNAGLILTGGRPRGTLYAVYEFLESAVGCLWLDRDTEVIPSTPDLTVGSLDIRSQPAFWWRGYYGGFFTLKPDTDMRAREALFRVRNKGNAEDSPAGMPEFGFGERMGPPSNSHTFFAYVDPKVWFKEHPEYFADDGTGKRSAGNMDAPGGSGSSICVTHPEVRKIVTEQLKKFIARGNESARKAGAPLPRVYDISQEDNAPRMCRCPACRVIIEREGSESGPNVEFINAIADAIREEHPHVLLQTFAYVSTEEPPRTLTVRDNVIIRWCDLYSRSEAVRPLTHPHNRGQAGMVRKWGRIAGNLFVWDYWYYGSHTAPDTHLHTLQPDLAFFHDNNVKGLFIEAEERDPTQSFYALARWLGHKLMQDPHQPAEPLIKRFVNGYYGPAAPRIREWMSYVEKRVAANPDKIIDSFPAPATRLNRRHWDLDFFVTAERLLGEAEAACPPGSRHLLHVRNERLPVLMRLVSLWDELEKDAAARGGRLPFSRGDVVDRMEAMWREQIAAQRSADWCKGLLEGMPPRMAILRTPPPLPDGLRELASDRITQFFWNDFHVYGSKIVDDPDAAGGRAIRLTTGMQGIDHTRRPHSMGVYNRTEKVSGPGLQLQDGDIPRDEEYHLFKIGRFRLAPSTIVWTHGSWLLSCFVDRAYQLADGADPSVNDRDIYVSLKFTGPAYVKGSAQEDAVWMDRVILVRP